ncbi:MAG: 3-deoxy-manno-octulosonate cytidylyltransferase [candidate division WOR-3 bacterium]
MKNIIVIPARYHSTRLKGKVLLKLGNKAVLEWVLDNVSKSKFADDIVVATEDERVYEFVIKLGYKCFITSDKHESGTDRIGEVLMNLQNYYYIINVQADEPFIKPEIIDKIFEELHNEKNAHIVTPITIINNLQEINNPNVVKVVFDKNYYAIYFSRSPIPYNRGGNAIYYKHIGLYGYKRDALFSFINLPKSYLENVEKLEQLRAIENGLKIKCVVVDYEGISIDTKEDLERAEEFIKKLKL